MNTALIIMFALLAISALFRFLHQAIKNAPFMDEEGMTAMDPPVDPLVILISIDEWKCRFKARIVERLMRPAPDDVFTLDRQWTKEDADEAAEAELSSVDLSDVYFGYENDPEASADESLSYWGDGV